MSLLKRSLLDLIQNGASLVIIKVGYVAAGFQDRSRFLKAGGKSGQHRVRVLANSQAARADGKCSRKHTADGFSGNTGKGEKAG
ncbi:uncharacterized protein METZ01_LOCUS30353 [marine metagenome]|uniref:Uncharacterized protein n=1 Tax=marine metagenome TaxID=408172 RepID=A0A381QGJ5_9ZZZZ